MFFNPFPWWFIVFVVIPFRLFSFVTYLPYYILWLVCLYRFAGLYKRMHHIAMENLQQFILQPINYLKHIKSIHKQIVEDSKRF
jgi:hypothetical protein